MAQRSVYSLARKIYMPGNVLTNVIGAAQRSHTRYLLECTSTTRTIVPGTKSPWQSIRNFTGKSTTDSPESTKSPGGSTATLEAGPQILSKLFPQTAATPSEEAERENKKQEEESRKEKETSWKRMKLSFALFGASTGMLVVWAVYNFGSPECYEDGNEIEDEFTKLPIVQQYLQRTWKLMTYYQKMIQQPSRTKLLPDPLKPPYIQPPYTLVLEMKDVLVHPDWTYKTGWRFKKRPGVDHFLEQCSKYFEIVVFTADQGMTVFPILDALDPNGFIMYRLVRDATHFVDGHHVKNLDSLNRDLKRVIVIDWDASSTKLHPDNAFNISRWTGNDDDTTLVDLVSFLRTIATAEIDDVREVLQYYKNFDNPLGKFRENQRKFLEQLELQEQEEKKKETPIVKRWTPSFLRSSR